MPCTGSDPAVTWASPSRPRIVSAPGFTVSPHSLSRGKRARSSTRTRTPERARTMAAIVPAGPAPLTSTSITDGFPRQTAGATEHDGAVLRAEAEAIAERRVDLDAAADVGDEVEIALRIGIAVIDRRRQEAVAQRQRRGDDAGGAARALRVADHRLGRRTGHAIGQRPKEPPHAARLDRVVEHGRRAVIVDVADLLERVSRAVDREL